MQFFAGSSDFIFAPYLKTGPEYRLSKNIFLFAEAGLQLFMRSSVNSIYPFISMKGSVLIPLSNDVSLELEGGMAAYISELSGASMLFIKAGFALR